MNYTEFKKSKSKSKSKEEIILKLHILKLSAKCDAHCIWRKGLKKSHQEWRKTKDMKVTRKIFKNKAHLNLGNRKKGKKVGIIVLISKYIEN